MSKGKKKTSFIPPTRYPDSKAVIMQQLKKQYDTEMTQATNNTFNLVASAMVIAAKDMGMDNIDLKELLDRCFGVLDDVADNLATIDSMLDLVASWGIDVYRTAEERTQYNGEVIAKKTAIYELLDNGIEEIGKLVSACKSHNISMDYRDVCRFKWEYDREKYYQEYKKYIEDGEDLTKQEEAFELFKQGKNNIEVMDITGCTKSTIETYKWKFNKERKGADSMANKNKIKAFELIEKGATNAELMQQLSITEAAAMRYFEEYSKEKNGGEIEIMTENMKKAFKAFDEGKTDEEAIKELGLGKGNILSSRKEWIRINKKNLTSEEMAAILSEEITETEAILKHKGVLKKEEKQVVEQEVPVNKPKLKKIVKLVEIQGEFATYKPVVGSGFDIEIDGQVITLSKEQLKQFAQEFIAVAEEV